MTVIVDEDGTLLIPLPDRYRHRSWNEKHALFRESAKRVAEYARELSRAEDAILAGRQHAAREASEWHRLYEKATNRAGQAEDLLRELADKAPETARLLELEAARQQLDDKLTEILRSHGIWRERCQALESKLRIVEAGPADAD